MQNLQHYYRDTQHWSAGHHLFIADDLIWVFTSLDTPGHARRPLSFLERDLVGSGTSWATTPPRTWAPEFQGNATRALAALYGLADMAPDALRLHREDPQTTHKDCPGTSVIKNDVIARVTAWIADKAPGEHIPGAVA